MTGQARKAVLALFAVVVAALLLTDPLDVSHPSKPTPPLVVSAHRGGYSATSQAADQPSEPLPGL